MIKFTCDHCVTCVFVQWGVPGVTWSRELNYFCLDKSRDCFSNLWPVPGCVLRGACSFFFGRSRALPHGDVDCNSARERATEVGTRTRQRGGCVWMHWFRKAFGYARLRDVNSFLPFQQTSRALTHRVLSRRVSTMPDMKWVTTILKWSSVEKLRYARVHTSVNRAAYAATDFDSDWLRLCSIAW